MHGAALRELAKERQRELRQIKRNKKYEMLEKCVPCPRCASKATTTVRYIGEYSYMGDWLRCRGCGMHTQVYQPKLEEVSVVPKEKTEAKE